MNEPFEIIYYAKEDGTKPIKEFLDSLPDKLAAKAYHDIGILKMNGNTLREPYSKPIEQGLFELRTTQSGTISRIFYFFIVGRKIILTSGFIKKTQNTPKSQIDLALKYKADYERRLGGFWYGWFRERFTRTFEKA